MDAVKFIKERDRMYEVAFQAPSLAYRHAKSAEQIVREVEEWSAAHPRKTRQSVFLEQWPDASIDREGVLIICPQNLDVNVSCIEDSTGIRSFKPCPNCRREFWMQEVE